MVVVMVEAQRFTAEQRYRIAQWARPGRLLMSIETAEMNESWENMFLTAPRPEDVWRLDRQLRTGRRLWAEVRRLIPPVVASPAHSDRKEKGSVQAQWAANLDECLASVLAAQEAGRLGRRVCLHASLVDDCSYLGRALASHGWLPVFRQELDTLLLPGNLEFIAAVTDAVAILQRWRSTGDASIPAGYSVAGEDPGGAGATGGGAEPSTTRDESAEDGGRSAALADRALDPAARLLSRVDEPLLPQLLSRYAGAIYGDWLSQLTEELAQNSLADFYSRLVGCAWADSFLTTPAARGRVEALLRDVGEERLTQLIARPLWEAWWYEVNDLLGRAEPGRRPVVQLVPAGQDGGALYRDGIYLCRGSEPLAAHYRAMSRVTDQLLVLYQDRSPLPSAAEESA